jgi:hypothetical protein
MTNDTAILLCYDASEHARAAAERCATLFPAGAVTVLAVWESYEEMVGHRGFGLYAPAPAIDEVNASIEQEA